MTNMVLAGMGCAKRRRKGLLGCVQQFEQPAECVKGFADPSLAC